MTNLALALTSADIATVNQKLANVDDNKVNIKQ